MVGFQSHQQVPGSLRSAGSVLKVAYELMGFWSADNSLRGPSAIMSLEEKVMFDQQEDVTELQNPLGSFQFYHMQITTCIDICYVNLLNSLCIEDYQYSTWKNNRSNFGTSVHISITLSPAHANGSAICSLYFKIGDGIVSKVCITAMDNSQTINCYKKASIVSSHTRLLFENMFLK